jgi:hypothetical protein
LFGHLLFPQLAIIGHGLAGYRRQIARERQKHKEGAPDGSHRQLILALGRAKTAVRGEGIPPEMSTTSAET